MNINFLQKKPYFIFEIENFLSDDQYTILNSNFPSPSNKNMLFDEGKKFSFHSRSDYYLEQKNNDCIKLLENIFDEKFFLNIYKDLKKEIIKSRVSNVKQLYVFLRKIKISNDKINKNMLQKLLYSYLRYSFQFSYMGKNSYIKPHTDSRTKLISLMLYFPSNEMEGKPLGTTFYHCEDKDFLNIAPNYFLKDNNQYFKDNFSEVLTFPFKKRNLYGFIKSDVSWHSVKNLDIGTDQIRKSINININI